MNEPTVTYLREQPPDDDPWAGENAAPGPRTVGVSSEEYFAKRVDQLEAELLDAAALDSIEPLEPVIADVLYRDTLARVYGASGTFKSFMTLDFAGCVGTGMAWHGQAVTQGPVIYLVAEGIRGIRKRVRAWEQHHGRKMTGVYFLPRPVQAMDLEWLVLIELCKRRKPALVVIDTQARVTVGIEENSNTEMGRVVDRMEQLRAASEACVLLVHHTGHDGDRGRGATAVKGALQTELGVERKGTTLLDTTITLKTGKQKDDEELGDVVFGLHQIALNGEAKEDGSPLTSVVLVPLDPVSQPQARTGQQGRVEEIAAALDKADVPVDWGRDRLRHKCSALGIQARNDLLKEVIEYRRNRANHLSPNLSPDVEGTGQDE
ncbi:AAA family ATPase [Streptomyces sp. NPDC086519]|uniref:AAA family ATPase n=1 Tax=Streptomyces sp. NPDC086519 TaxID=3154863 RepID=UPI0034178A44